MSRNVAFWILWTAAFGALIAGVNPLGANADQSEGTGEDTGAYEIAVVTHPEPSAIVPDQDLVELRVRVTRGGEPARDVDLSYRLYAPPRTFWFSTDFPVVEGTPLLDGTVTLPAGVHETAMVLPIRGPYRFETRVEGPRGSASKTVRFDVNENPREKGYLAVFLGVLLLIGAAAGYLVSRASTPPGPAGLMVGLLSLGLMTAAGPTAVHAHGAGDWDPETLREETGFHGTTGERVLDVDLFPRPVRVGELLSVRLRVRSPGDPDRAHDHPDAVVRADARFVHAEGGLEMIRQAVFLEEGRARFDVQLFDGAPHYLVVDLYRVSDPAPAGHDHEHGEDTHGETAADEAPWEEMGLYTLREGEHTVRFRASSDPSMKWVLVKAAGDHPDERARQWFGTECPSVQAGGRIDTRSPCVVLALNPDGTRYDLDVDASGRYRLYTQHVPDEFDMTLRDPDGDTVTARRRVRPGKGEYLGRLVRRVGVRPVSPPIDDIVKSMLTLMGVVLAGFLGGYYLPRWLG